MRLLIITAAVCLLCAPCAHAGTINVIPTPKQVIEGRGEMAIIKGGRHAIIVLPSAKPSIEHTAAEQLNKFLQEDFKVPALPVRPAQSLSAAERESNLILIGSPATHPLIKKYASQLKEAGDFLAKTESGQAYSVDILPAANGQYVAALTGKGDAGILYAAVTFLQLVQRTTGGYAVPVCRIRDYPDFTYRWACSRNVKAGEELRWKVNLTPYLDLHYNFAPDSGGCLAINRKARALQEKAGTGIMGYLGQTNRESYPDGKAYPCIEQTLYGRLPNANAGYCPSNAKLLELRQDALRTFVTKNEPGFLYIHFVDWDTYGLASDAWQKRCSACRKRWPNDAIEAADGKAGAQAWVMDGLAQALFSVKTESGYDASKDCVIAFVSDPYTRWSEPDDIWDKEVEYYVNISKAMTQVDNVLFVLREQGPRQDGRRMRIAEITEALKRRGKGHGIFLYLEVGSGLTTYRNWPVRHQLLYWWLATPVLCRSFNGARGVMLVGRAHIALKSEYMWNQQPVGGYWEAPAKRGQWGVRFASLLNASSALSLPDGVFGRGKLFDRIHRNLYGDAAGQIIADAVRPNASSYGLVYPEISHHWLANIDKVRSYTDLAATQANWLKLFTAIAKRNQNAVEAFKRALAAEDLKPGKVEEVKALLGRFERGLYWANIAGKESRYCLAALKGDDAVAESLHAELMATLRQCAPTETDFAQQRSARLSKAQTLLKTVRSDTMAWAHKLDELAKQAPTIRKQIKAEIKTLKRYDVSPLGYLRIGLIGGDLKIWAPGLFQDKAIKNMEFVPGGLTEAIMNYDVICYDSSKKCTPEQIALIRNFIAAGRGFFLVRATPYFMVGSTDLSPIADWLGAKAFGNWQGKLSATLPCIFTQDLDPWLQEYTAGHGSAILAGPLTGVPILVLAKRRNLIFLMANKYRSGRVIYISSGAVPQPLLRKILLWLGWNKLYG